MVTTHTHNANYILRTFASSAPTSASLAIAQDFNVSREISYLITSLFLVGYVVGELLISKSLTIGVWTHYLY